MADCKPISTPMQPNIQLSHSQSPQIPEDVQFIKFIPYLTAVGALIHLATTTQPDIAYVMPDLQGHWTFHWWLLGEEVFNMECLLYIDCHLQV